MKKGWHSKSEMDLRGETDLTYVLAKSGHSIADEQDGNYSRSSVLLS